MFRKQMVLDLEDLDIDEATLAEAQKAAWTAFTEVISKAQGEPDPDAIQGWTEALAAEFVDRLRRRGATVQLQALAFQAHHDGVVPRADVYRLGGYKPTRRLNGFRKPTQAVHAEMVAEGLLPADAAPVSDPQYDPTRLSFQQAKGFETAPEVAAVFAQVLADPDAA